MYRAERRHRLLKDEGNLLAANLADLVSQRVERGQVDGAAVAVQNDFAAHDAPGPWHDAQDGQRHHRLSAAALSDHAQGSSALHGKADAVDRLDRAFGEREVGPQAVDLDQRVVHQR